jgi:alpha-L-arabinofuranosidase
VQLASTAKLTTLAADSPEAENSMETPTKYIPQETTLSGITDHYQLELKPYSISILRLKDLAWKGQASKKKEYINK